MPPAPAQLRQRAEELRRMVQANPGAVDAMHELGVIEYMLGDTARALELLARVADNESARSSVYYDYGFILRRAGQTQRAVEALRRAVAINPSDVNGHRQLGEALQEQAKIEEAIACYRRVLELKPDDATAHSNLLLWLNYSDAFTPAQIFQEHREFDRRHAGSRVMSSPRTSAEGRRIRVGYLSPDFRQHSVSFFIMPILMQHDRSRFEAACYSDVREPDGVTQLLRTFPEHWHDVAAMNDDALAERIICDKIDILVDLAGHTASNRLPLLARKPAPIQVTYLGYPNTTGLTAIDYRITDALADPVGATEALHTEKLVRLPDAFACFMPPEGYPEVALSPALKTNHITFGVYTNFAKVRPNMVRLWSRILEQLPNSRLVVQAKALDDAGTREEALAAFASHGVCGERIELRGWIDFLQYVADFDGVDIVLDTYPFNGHTTTCHALWMGVPVVTLAGPTHRSRMGLSVLTTLKLAELVAHDDDEYVRLAVTLVSDLPRLQELRRTMRDRMRHSPILDSRSFCRNLEAAYEQMME